LCRFFFVGDYIFAVNLSDVICISGSVIAGHGVVRSAFVVVGYTVPHDAVCDGPAVLPTGFADTVFREITVCRVECPIVGTTAYGSIITDCAVVGAFGYAFSARVCPVIGTRGRRRGVDHVVVAGVEHDDTHGSEDEN